MRSVRRRIGDKPRSALLFGCNVLEALSIWCVLTSTVAGPHECLSSWLCSVEKTRENEREKREACLDWS